MSKQIPELTIIPTPTAGQESIIETVVARHDTYATSRMTLAQIFTLGSISGAIKSALDTLSGLIAGNTSSINTLSSTKLNIAGGTRTGLTANRALITDASGNEAYLTGTTTQVIGFDGAGKPIAVTPTVDINGSTEKTSTIGATDMLLMYDVAGGANKKHLAQASVTNEGLVEMCTDAEVTTHTDTTRYANIKQIYDMQNRYIFVNPHDAAIETWSPYLTTDWWAFPSTGTPKIYFYIPIKGAHTAISSITLKVHASLTLTGDPVLSLYTLRYRNGVARVLDAPANVTIPAVHTSNNSYDVALPSSLFSWVSIQAGDVLRFAFGRAGSGGTNYAGDYTVTGFDITLS